MENYLHYIITAVITFLVSFAIKYVGPKSRIVWWNPHSFHFSIPLNPMPENPNPQPVQLLTETLTIQNLGTKASKDIEIAHQSKPDFFKLNPALDYTVTITPDNEHLIKIPYLAPKEWVNIEFMTYDKVAQFLYIRSEWGHAKFIQTQPQRILPKWLLTILQVLLFVGILASSYWGVKAFLYIADQIK